MKRFIFILLIACCACTYNDINKCIDPDKWGEIKACPEYLDPVCGCDNITYPNPCFAKAAGVVSWTKGECN